MANSPSVFSVGLRRLWEGVCGHLFAVCVCVCVCMCVRLFVCSKLLAQLFTNQVLHLTHSPTHLSHTHTTHTTPSPTHTHTTHGVTGQVEWKAAV